MKKSEANIEDLRNQTVSWGTHRPDDLIPKFMAVLKEYGKEAYDKYVSENPEVEDWKMLDDETKGWVVDELFDLLDGIAPEDCYFGAHPGDGADFGFWQVDADESKKEEGKQAEANYAKEAELAFRVTSDKIADYFYDGAYDLDPKIDTAVHYDSNDIHYESTDNGVVAEVTMTFEAVTKDVDKYASEFASLASAAVDDATGEANNELAEYGQDLSSDYSFEDAETNGNTWTGTVRFIWKHTVTDESKKKESLYGRPDSEKDELAGKYYVTIDNDSEGTIYSSKQEFNDYASAEEWANSELEKNADDEDVFQASIYKMFVDTDTDQLDSDLEGTILKSDVCESKKNEAKYDGPVTLYGSTRYDDAEEAQKFLDGISGGQVKVSKDRNGDMLIVSIAGSDEDIDAFLEVYKDNYDNFETDCDANVMGWTSPGDLPYLTVQGRKELTGESKKSEGLADGDAALLKMQKSLKPYADKTTGEIAADIRYDVATALDMPADEVDDVMQNFGLDNIYILRSKGLSPKAIAQKILKSTKSNKSEARPTKQDAQIKELCKLCRNDKNAADSVFKALTKDYNTSLDPVLAGQYLMATWKSKLEELGGCNGWYDGFKKLYAAMCSDFVCSVLQDLKLGSSEIGCGACITIVDTIYDKVVKRNEAKKSEGEDEEAFGKFEDAVKSILMDKYGVVDSHGPSDETANSLVLQYGVTLQDAFDKGGENGYDPTSVALLIITRKLREAPQFFDDCKDFTFNKDPKKSESLTLKQKELKNMTRYGEATDITTISDAEAKELKKKGIETVGISRGAYGMNGALLRDNEGNKYVITARSSNLFYFV